MSSVERGHVGQRVSVQKHGVLKRFDTNQSIVYTFLVRGEIHKQESTPIVLENGQADSLRRVLRTQRNQYLDTWKKRSLTLQELQDNANIGQVMKKLS